MLLSADDNGRLSTSSDQTEEQTLCLSGDVSHAQPGLGQCGDGSKEEKVGEKSHFQAMYVSLRPEKKILVMKLVSVVPVFGDGVKCLVSRQCWTTRYDLELVLR